MYHQPYLLCALYVHLILVVIFVKRCADYFLTSSILHRLALKQSRPTVTNAVSDPDSDVRYWVLASWMIHLILYRIGN